MGKQAIIEGAWIKRGRGRGYYAPALKEDTSNLSAGMYQTLLTPDGNFLIPQAVNRDALAHTKRTVIDDIVKEIYAFNSDIVRERYRDFGFCHKRGYLLYGPPGCGKTTLLWQLSDIATKEFNAVGLYVRRVGDIEIGVDMIRRTDGNRMILAVCEDFEHSVKGDDDESEWLNFLDGGLSTENFLFVATTNQIEEIDARFTKRPSRFDRVINVSLPGLDERLAFIQSKAPKLRTFVQDDIAEKSMNMSFAHIREILIMHCCMEYTVDTAVDRMKELMDS